MATPASPALRLLVTITIIILGITPTLVRAHWPKKLGDRSAATVYAVALRDITIDGRLDDWPANLVRYRVVNNWSPYGPSDLAGKSLQDNPDLSAQFMVGYDAERQLLYVAGIVRDDVHVPVNNSEDHFPWETDAFEVYDERVDGVNLERMSP
ncbi:MAG: hypothetical protein CMJ18_06155 [Phycisphaeraceae bacterium]|nr:hypothetical protein [Phycisphaeraceae bacterium]